MEKSEEVPLIPETGPDDVSEALMIPKIQVPGDNSETSTENNDTPPMSPADEISEDEASIEEPTVEEVATFRSHSRNMEYMRRNSDTDIIDNMLPLSVRASRSRSRERARNHLDFKIYLRAFLILLITGVFVLTGYGIYINHDVIFNAGDEKNYHNLMLIPREKWVENPVLRKDKWSSYEAKRVVVIHTETQACESFMDCLSFLNKGKDVPKKEIAKFNFLLAPDGYVYESLGWQEPSPLFTDTPTMVISFIGNYEERAPSVVQLVQLQALLDESEKLNYLAATYTIHGRKFKKEPTKLYSYLSKFAKWDKTRYGMENKQLHREFELFPNFEL